MLVGDEAKADPSAARDSLPRTRSARDDKRSEVRREHAYFVYLIASRSRTLYCGVSNSIRRRTMEHRSCEGDGFTAKYSCWRLVWFERFQYVNNAIAREKQIKRWGREKKVALIEMANPTWEDLSADWG